MKLKSTFYSGSALLGILFIVVGLIAGVVLVMQPQLFNQKAQIKTDYYPRPTASPYYVNCGGAQCLPQDCHCQGGNLCTSLRCDPSVRESCLSQGRSWCKNDNNAPGYGCCQSGYVCNTNGVGCRRSN